MKQTIINILESIWVGVWMTLRVILLVALFLAPAIIGGHIHPLLAIVGVWISAVAMVAIGHYKENYP